MKTLLRSMLVLVVVAGLAALLAGALVWQHAPLNGTFTLGDHGITVDGHDLFDRLEGWQAALAAALAVCAVAGAALLAVLAVLVGLGAAVFGVALAVIATTGSLMIVALPLVAVAGLVWLVVRRRPGAAPGPHAARAGT